MDMELFPLLASIAVGFALAFTLGWKLKGRSETLDRVVDAIVENYLDERRFNVNDLKQRTGLDDAELRKALGRLERAGLITRVEKGSYRLRDPLVFLTERDYDRAMRLTKDDNLLYGAYQNPYLPRLYLFLVYGLFLADLVFVVGAYLGYVINGPFSPFVAPVMRLLPPGRKDLYVPFLLFLLGMGLVFVDFIDNIIKAWARERFMVIVGALSGISYDKTFADELSGRIRRGQIVKVDLNVSLLQKLINYFRSVPLGDVTVVYRVGKEERVESFRNMPFPRELFYVIRSIQLGALQWRKRYARTLMLWRARTAIPSAEGGGRAWPRRRSS